MVMEFVPIKIDEIYSLLNYFHAGALHIDIVNRKVKMDLNPIKDAFDRVAKKQKLSGSKAQEVIDQIMQEIENAVEIIRSEHSGSEFNYTSVLPELNKKLQEISPLSQLEGAQKELNIALSKYPKQLEKSFNPDISKAYRNIDFDNHTINQIIASHFYRHGLLSIGDCFVNEAEELESTIAMRSLFSEMYMIVEAMKDRNLEPALRWAAANSDKLKKNGSDLQLKLHRLQFMEILQNGSRSEALHMQELILLLLHPPIWSLANWNTIADELTRQFCNLLGLAFESPLSVTIAAGFQGLPPLLKFMTVMAGKKQEWHSMKQLPVPVELDKEFQFHSIFVCPVSKEPSTDENPPMLMSCGHVLCKQSINKMSKNSSKIFKCPYCPSDSDATQSKGMLTVTKLVYCVLFVDEFLVNRNSFHINVGNGKLVPGHLASCFLSVYGGGARHAGCEQVPTTVKRPVLWLGRAGRDGVWQR
ncbi:hypothetical protein GH714_016455 [Hevea brasiliensis]|uniref:RING-Gid-type domain-containing protein n=1 Tax=Hevea brasiliensis TaxID=3981 RepID=A0A6A6K6K0_HEVBR|nr:hypothetical protein GH714_016455 [Hevea brasiliensis]